MSCCGVRTGRASLFAIALMLGVLVGVAPAQTIRAAPDRPAGEGEGPFERLILRGVTLIDGTGAPPQGPVDIVIERNRIVEVRSVGYPNLPIRPDARPGGATREIDGTGLYVLPGFVDCTSTPAAGARRRTRSTSTSCGWRTASPPSAACRPARSTGRCASAPAAPATRSPRRASSPMPGRAPAKAGSAGRSRRPRRRASGCTGRGQGRRRPQALRRGSRHHAGADRTGARAEARDDRAPRPDRRGPHEPPRRRPPRPARRRALVRPARVAVRRPHRPALSARLQLQRRVAPLRPGRRGSGTRSTRAAARSGTS